MRQSLLHYAEQIDEDDNVDFPPLLRTVLRPASHCPLFDVMIEKEHTWPCANLLNGSSRYQAQYQNGTHLVMSDNRLLVARKDEHFYCPPWNGLIHDACIQQRGPHGDSLLAVGLSDGIYLALLQEKPRLQVIDDIFLALKQSVEKIVFLRDGEMALCYGNADVETFRISVDNQPRTLSVLSSRRQHPLKILQAVASLWDSRRYQDSAYDSSSGKLFLLSKTDLTVWANTATDAFTAVCSVPVQQDTVAILPSSQMQRYAMLILSDGGRRPVIFEELSTRRPDEVRTVMRLGSVRPLPEGVCVDTIQMACQDAEGTIILYDSRTCSLIMLTVSSLFYEGIYDDVEVVSILRLSSPSVGVACASNPEDPSASFIVYGKGGMLCHIGVRPLGYIFSDLLQRQQGSSDLGVRTVLRGLGSKRGMKVLTGAAFAGGSIETLSVFLNDFMQPSFHENRMSLSSGVHGLLSLLRREMMKAEWLWKAPFSWHLVSDLERIAAHLGTWHKTLEMFLRPYGWLDSPGKMNLSWNGFVATSPENFTIRAALNAQAVFLETALKGLRDASVLCSLYSLLLRSNQGAVTSNTRGSRLLSIVWGDNSERSITTLCMEILLNTDNFIMEQLEVRKDILPLRARHAINIHAFILENQPTAALAYACDKVRSLRHEQIFDYVAEKLEERFPDRMPHLRLMLCWLRYSQGSIMDLLGMLERYKMNESSDRLKLRLEVVFQSLTEYPALQHAVVNWMVHHPLGDSNVIGFAEVLDEHSIVIEKPQSLTALFFFCWSNRKQRPSVAAHGFRDIAKTKQRLALSSRMLCIKLALEYGPTTSEQLVYLILLLQKELIEAIEAARHTDNAQFDTQQEHRIELDIDELSQYCLEERRLFELAGQYKEYGGAKVQLDLLKVHPETPERVTVEVVHDLLEFLMKKGMSATEAVRNVVREYYDGYAPGLSLLPFLTFLAHHGESAEKIAAVLQSGGVPPDVVFDVFSGFLDERPVGTTFPTGSLVTALAAMVDELSGESREFCSSYLMEHIHSLLAGEHGTMTTTMGTVTKLQEGDIMQLKNAKSLLTRLASVSPA